MLDWWFLEKQKPNWCVSGAGELFDLFKRRLRRALFPRGELRKAVRQRSRVIARALASPAQSFCFDLNSNHLIQLSFILRPRL